MARLGLAWLCHTQNVNSLFNQFNEFDNSICLFFFYLNIFFRMNQPLSGSGGGSLRSRQVDNSSPTPSDDSDSDISLGTHSPVPSSLSLQHSPGSTSGGGNDDRLLHDDLQRDREKEFRSFSLGGFPFDTHSPAMAGKFTFSKLFTLNFILLNPLIPKIFAAVFS